MRAPLETHANPGQAPRAAPRAPPRKPPGRQPGRLPLHGCVAVDGAGRCLRAAAEAALEAGWSGWSQRLERRRAEWQRCTAVPLHHYTVLGERSGRCSVLDNATPGPPGAAAAGRDFYANFTAPGCWRDNFCECWQWCILPFSPRGTPRTIRADENKAKSAPWSRAPKLYTYAHAMHRVFRCFLFSFSGASLLPD